MTYWKLAFYATKLCDKNDTSHYKIQCPVSFMGQLSGTFWNQHMSFWDTSFWALDLYQISWVFHSQLSRIKLQKSFLAIFILDTAFYTILQTLKMDAQFPV